MVNGRKGIYVHSLKYETIEGYKHVHDHKDEWDHKDEIDADIERRIKLADEIFEELGPSPLSAKLKAKEPV